MRLWFLILLIFAPFNMAYAQEMMVQVASPSQELLWKAQSLENKTKYLPKDQQDWAAVAAAYKASADLGHPDAMYDYARILGFTGKSNEAETWYIKSSEKGSTMGQYAYATLLINRSTNNCPQAMQLYKTSADNGWLLSIEALSWFLEESICGRANKTEIEKYLKLGIERGSPISYYNYGDFLLDGNFFGTNDQMAMVYYFVAINSYPQQIPMNYKKETATFNYSQLYKKLEKNGKLAGAYTKLHDLCAKQSYCQNLPPAMISKIKNGQFATENGFKN